MFFIVVPIVLGAINYYIYRTASAAYPQLSVLFATWIILSFLSLFLAIFLEKQKKLALSLPFSWIGYTWFGVSGIALATIATTDLIQVITQAFNDRFQFQLVFTTVLALSIWSVIEARRFRVRKVRIHSEKLRILEKPIRIVQISDLHLGDSSTIGHIQKIVSKVNELKPDIVVSTGDLFDGYLELMAPFVDSLREIEAPMGKFAVSGNHEVYAGLEEAMSLTELAGFTLLRDTHQAVTAHLTIAGVEDQSAPSIATEADALNTLSSAPFHLLLKHRPDFDPQSEGKFDLQLSGHTHGGQIFPFHLLTSTVYKARPGLSELAPKQQLYLSRGTGSWGPQMRLFAPPEITLLELSR
ncbi:metallophosphoesterase [Pelagicoccus mobilis]|uniref:Metallophosphoesterase n=1 Tax=Pelagicoccus mobilis TaxID=415221 RepID=A0A934RU94_9BACT|nr:metallophosphoesterase [Pelagicoccus mobilis]MBK1876521.1 metallophosphoesterase [Pelagicoccus mobilis]